MGLFNRHDNEDDKRARIFAFGEILRGLQHAVGSAVEMLQAQQLNAFSRFWDSDGNPITQKVRINSRMVDVPLITVVPHNTLQMEDVEVRFKAQIGDVSQEFKNGLTAVPLGFQSQADMLLSMTRADNNDDGSIEVTVRFKIKDQCEAISRIIDSYNATL